MKDISIDELQRGIELVISNAEALIQEAELLYEHSSYARAYSLSHLAREELSKVTMLHATAIRLIVGHAVDWKHLEKRFRDHSSKLSQDALLNIFNSQLEGVENPEQFVKAYMSSGSARNKWKNDSLYVGFEKGKFHLPADRLKPETAKRTIAIARLVLADTKQMQAHLGALPLRDPDKIRATFANIPDLQKLVASDNENIFRDIVTFSKGRRPS